MIQENNFSNSSISIESEKDPSCAPKRKHREKKLTVRFAEVIEVRELVLSVDERESKIQHWRQIRAKRRFKKAGSYII